MKTRSWSVVLLVAGAAACSDATNPSAPARLAPLVQGGADLTAQNIADEYIVVLRKGSDVPGEAAKARAVGGAILAQWEHALKGYHVRLSPEALTELRRNPNVVAVSPNGVIHAIATQTPADWGLDRMDQRTNALDNNYTYPNTGTGVHAYIVDTGINLTHSDYSTRIDQAHSRDFTNGLVGGGTNFADQNGHGSHVAGTVGGTTWGVAKNVTLHAVRVLDAGGSGQWAWYINGLNWIIANKQLPAVANASLGGGINAGADAATDALAAAGITFAIASGNSSTNACSLSPSNRGVTAGVISTNAAGNFSNPAAPPTPIDSHASFSDFGPCTDIYAPGVNIKSAWIGSTTATSVISGTSMASPHVAGAAALYLGNNPNMTPPQVEAAMKADATAGVITGIPPNPAGTPNLLVYIGNIGGGGSNQPPVANWIFYTGTSANPTCTVNQVCTLDGTSSTDDVGVVSYQWKLQSGQVVNTNAMFTKTFTAATSVPLTLTVTDAGGLTNSLTKTLVVGTGGGGNQPPTAAFTFSCDATHFCSFDGTSSTDDVGIVSYSWTLASGQVVATTSTFTKQFTAARTFTLTLKVTDGGGLNNSITKTIVVP